MSSNKPKPLVFPSIKLGTLADSEQGGATRNVVSTPADPVTADATPPEPQPEPELQPEPEVRPEPEPTPSALQTTPRETEVVSRARSSEPAPVEASRPLAPLPRLSPPRSPPNRGPAIAAVIASILWVGGVVAYTVGYQPHSAALAGDPFAIAVVAALALAPLGFFWAAALAVRQARALGDEARRSKQLTDLMVGPAAIAAAEAGSIVETLRRQVDAASAAGIDAVERLTALRDILARETAALAEAANSAHRTAVALTDGMSKERNQMNTLAVMLDARAAAVAGALNEQGKMINEAAEYFDVRMGEAEASLVNRTTDLAAAAGEAIDASRAAGDDLARQIARLETAGLGVGDQLRALEDGLTHQRASLVTVAHALRADQEDFAALTESRTAQLSTFIANSSRDVASLNEVTSIGAQSLSDLIEAAAVKFRELAEAARAERDLFANSALSSLDALSEAGARERKALEDQMRQTIEALSSAAGEAREAADVHAEAARARVEQLNEAAFAAGQKADHVFEARLTEARGLIEQSAKLVDEAGAKTAAKLEQGVAEARSALESLQTVIGEVDDRMSGMPEEAEARAETVRAAIAKGMDDLLSTARRAADETQAIDAAFQDRVKRNYEMLSEAVQLMGVVARGAQSSDVLRRPDRPARIGDRPAAPAEDAEQAALPSPQPREAEQRAAATPPEPTDTGFADIPDRPRLKLTPTASDQEFKAVFDSASGGSAPAPVAGDGGWTWKELLTSIDGDSASQDAEQGRSLFKDIEGMGIDPTALLSRNRVDEIAAAIQVEDLAGAREVVRALAPAAVRRLSRRLITDAPFRAKGQDFVERYAGIIAEAMRRDRGGYQAAALLASDAGRAYLLLDAAAGEAG